MQQALGLLFSVYMWLVCVVMTPAHVLEYAAHMADEGEHYEPYGYHVPPPLLYSLSHSLRAPPTLIPA